MPNTKSSNWFWGDYLVDPNVALCSLAAQGLWARILGYCSLSERYGHLMVGGRKLSTEGLATLIGHPLAEVQVLMDELENNRVFSRTYGGVVYNRRMVLDASKAQASRENGKRGGNPILCKDKEKIGQDNPPLKPRARVPLPLPLPLPKESEAAVSTISREGTAEDEGSGVDETAPPPMSGPGHHPNYASSIEQLERKVFAPEKIHTIQVWKPLNDWLLKGYDLELDIIPVIRDIVTRQHIQDPSWQPKNLSYFSDAIAKFRVRRIMPPPGTPNRNHLLGGKLTVEEKLKWITKWGMHHLGSRHPDMLAKIEENGLTNRWEYEE